MFTPSLLIDRHTLADLHPHDTRNIHAADMDQPRQALAATVTATLTVSIAPVLRFAYRVLELAWWDAKRLRPCGVPKKTAVEAYQWLLSDSWEPCSFRWCCLFLNLDPQRVRQQGINVSEVGGARGLVRTGSVPDIAQGWKLARKRALELATPGQLPRDWDICTR